MAIPPRHRPSHGCANCSAGAAKPGSWPRSRATGSGCSRAAAPVRGQPADALAWQPGRYTSIGHIHISCLAPLAAPRFGAAAVSALRLARLVVVRGLRPEDERQARDGLLTEHGYRWHDGGPLFERTLTGLERVLSGFSPPPTTDDSATPNPALLGAAHDERPAPSGRRTPHRRLNGYP